MDIVNENELILSELIEFLAYYKLFFPEFQFFYKCFLLPIYYIYR